MREGGEREGGEREGERGRGEGEGEGEGKRKNTEVGDDDTKRFQNNHQSSGVSVHNLNAVPL